MNVIILNRDEAINTFHAISKTGVAVAVYKGTPGVVIGRSIGEQYAVQTHEELQADRVPDNHALRGCVVKSLQNATLVASNIKGQECEW